MPGPWKKVTVTKQWSLEGGYLNKPLALDTKEVDTTDGTVAFVKLDKNADWLRKAVLGKTAPKGALRRSTLVDTLKQKLAEKVSDEQLQPGDDVESSPRFAVAERAPADPMDPLDDISSTNALTPKKRKVYVSKRGKNNITDVRMPEFEPTSRPAREELKTVRLLALSTNSL